MHTNDPRPAADARPVTSPDSIARAGTRVILASGSPRRRLLLPIICPVDSTLSPEADETPLPDEPSEALASRLARDKLGTTRQQLGDNPRPTIVISADTVVSLDGQPLGKPASAGDARAMLRSLRGRSHNVITAIALWESAANRTCLTSVATEVAMRQLNDAEIERYIERGEPFDKAGGYAIQDAQLRPVRAIGGCFPNVVGLPLCAVQSMLDGGVAGSSSVRPSPPCELCQRASGVLSRNGFWADLEGVQK